MSVARPTRAALRRTLFATGLTAALAASACSGEVITAKSGQGPEDSDLAAPVAVNHFVRSANPIPGHYIVVMNDAVTFASGNNVQALSLSLATGYRAQVRATYQHALRGFSAEMTEEDARALAEDPMVAFVEEDSYVSIESTQTGAVEGIDRVDQSDLPLNKTYNFDADGTGVTAYVIDTGIRITHQEFGGRASVLFDAIGDGQNGIDCNGHGTHVAGTIGGKTFGLAKNVTLKAVRVLGCNGSGSNAGVIQGIDAVVKDAVGKPAVANMSLGGPLSQNRAVQNAVENAVAKGIVFAVAAGNESSDACKSEPASAPNAITVAAADPRNDLFANFSNFGTCVDIIAPGVNIKSAFAGSDTQTNTISGTSMATPHVAGAVALYLSVNPTAKPAQVAADLIANASNGRVKSVPANTPNKLLFTGFIKKGGATPPPTPPTPPPAAGQQVVGTASGTVQRGRSQTFTVNNVVAGTTFATQLQGDGFGDVDLFVNTGAPATQSRNNCSSDSPGSTESCSFKVPGTGVQTVFITVFGFRADNFDLQANFTIGN